MEHSPYALSPSQSPSLVNFQTSINLPNIGLHIPFSQVNDIETDQLLLLTKSNDNKRNIKIESVYLVYNKHELEY